MKNHSLPAEYKIREARISDAEKIAFVHLESWRTTYKNIIDQQFLDNLKYENRLQLRKDILNSNSDFHLVITYKEKIIGFSDVGPLKIHKSQQIFEDQKILHTIKGEILSLYILKDHQHQGIGTSLFKVVKTKLNQANLIPFIIWVLKDNLSARKFYEKQGGKLIGETMILIGDRPYPEVAYYFQN